MPSDDPWQPIQNELSTLMNDLLSSLPSNEYRSLQPLLEKFKQRVDAQQRSYPNYIFMTPKHAATFLQVFRDIQTQALQGGNHQQLIEQTVSGSVFNQSGLNVLGNLNQAGRDVVFQIFGNALSPIQQQSVIKVPIVLLVMNSVEANELASEAFFSVYPDSISDDFRQLKQLLIQDRIANWVERYKGRAEDWLPFSDNQENKTIAQLLETAFIQIEGYQKRIVPSFVDIHTINEQSNRRLLWKLRKDGCVVVMDVISMRHPVIQQGFRRSLLDAFPNTLVVRIAPNSHALNFQQQMIALVERSIDLEFYKRRRVDLDASSAEVVETDDFLIWLIDKVIRLLPVEERVKTGILGKMYS